MVVFAGGGVGVVVVVVVVVCGVWWLRWLLCVGCSFFILCRRRRGLRWVGGGSGRFGSGLAFFLAFGTAR